jgi:hypothetical protein
MRCIRRNLMNAGALQVRKAAQRSCTKPCADSRDAATDIGVSGHTALSISGPVRDTALSAAASRPNSSPTIAVEKRMAVAIERNS